MSLPCVPVLIRVLFPMRTPLIIALQIQVIISTFILMKKSLGFVGLGLMGSAMSLRLIRSGHPLVVHNRTKDRATTLLAEGAQWGTSPADVASKADVVFSMVSTSVALQTISSPPDGILAGLASGGIHVDCSTVSPDVTQELGGKYKAAGKFFLHCPVLGSTSQAAEGALLLMPGGDASAITTVEPLLRIFGSKIWKFDSQEQASHAKLLCNLFIAGAITTLIQALLFAEKASVPPSVLLDIIGNSALNSSTYQTKGKSILEQDFHPRFYVEHMLKDINLMIEAAGAKGVSLPAIEVARQLFSKAMEMGLAREDYSAVVKTLDGWS